MYLLVDENGNPVGDEPRNAAPWDPAGRGFYYPQTPPAAPPRPMPMIGAPPPAHPVYPVGGIGAPPPAYGYTPPPAYPMLSGPAMPTAPASFGAITATPPVAMAPMQAPVGYAPPGQQPFLTINGTSLDLGTLLQLGARVYASVKALPEPPDMTEDEKTNFERLTAFVNTGLQHFKSDEKLRAFADVGALLLTGRALLR